MIATSAVFAPHFSDPSWECESPQSSKTELISTRLGGTQNLQAILRKIGLTVSAISNETRLRFGERTPYFVPRTFVYKYTSGITPHICQLIALSEVTGFRLSDWMSVCGFDPVLIDAVQLKVPAERTTIVSFASSLDSVSDSNSIVQAAGRFLYAKIGARDAVLSPLLHPGAIIRVDRSYPPDLLQDESPYFWLVQHPAGTTCCRLKPIGDGQVLLLPNRFPLSPWPLRLGRHARILGVVDCELHAPSSTRTGRMYGGQKDLSRIRAHAKMSISHLIQTSRRQTGLTFRDAHKATLRVAALLQDHNFGISLGLLSDYEAVNTIPRHIAKIFSLCVIYGINFWQFLDAGGAAVSDHDKRSLFD